ncbi:MAG: hypothetical protein A3K18_21150 [Lentisphaerae bacterium RIFOXYA12_64_32]|nr:MAG: hypothetical protein A3K18_21150 [Lentisphaerae bacterium RIFOXYA12_64_32]
MLRGLLMAGGGVQLLVCAAMAAPVAPTLRMYSQQLEVEYATADDAGRASVDVAPVYDGRDWAFSARWDDCSLNSLQMRQHMAKFGLKGTFYLTQNNAKNNFGPEYCKELMQDGFSIGGHTMTHPKLPELDAGKIWWELCANRVGREDDTETPLNSLAFSYGQFRSDKPEAFLMISEAVRRTGYHHCVYADFVRNNPNLAPGEFSTGCQVVPGDKVVDAQKFQADLEKPVSRSPEAYRKWSHCIFLGVHAWQAGEEWNKLDAVFQTISGKPEWWYCNQTEWAAYARQVTCSELKAEPAEAAAVARRYALSRPVPGDLGTATPLTCVIGKANVKGVKLDGQTVPFETRGAAVVVNLPHGQGQALPQRIGHIEVPTAAQALADSLECADFPGLKGLLVADPAQQKLSLTLDAPTACELRNVHIRFRLPLQYEPGIVIKTLDSVKAGAPQTVDIALPAPKPEPFWSEGPQYWVAEIDFTGPTGAGRLFVTRLVP